VRTDGTDGRFACQAIPGAAMPPTRHLPGLAFTPEHRVLGTRGHDIGTSAGGGGFAVPRGRSENDNPSIRIGLRHACNLPPPSPVIAPVAPPGRRPRRRPGRLRRAPARSSSTSTVPT
jgi:hypothetical protein